MGKVERRPKAVSGTDGSALAHMLGDRDRGQDKKLEALIKPGLFWLRDHYPLTLGKKSRVPEPMSDADRTNGTRVERLNWEADLSPKGLFRSYGMMVNYAYRLSGIDANNESSGGMGR